MQETPQTAPEPTTGRKRVFWLVMLATPALILGLIEGAARWLAPPHAARDPKLSLMGPVGFFATEERDGRLYVRVSHREVYARRNIEFSAEKEPGTVRIFCLGGSASAGWPHPPSEIYSVYLQSALRRAHPDRRIEVINLSAHAYASYRVRLIVERVLEFDPDAIVLYSGNNEFLEKRTYWATGALSGRAQRAANRLASFRLARSWLVKSFFPANVLSAAHREHVVYEQWSKIQRMALELREDPVQFEQVKEHYALTIESMVREAGERGVPVVLVTVPVNLRDWRPNVSYNRLSGADLARFDSAFRAGRGALLRQDPETAGASFREGLSLEPLHAETHYQLARALEARGEYARALESYRRANDLDYNPFRAISDFNASIRAVARSPNAHLADVETSFLDASAPLAPGFDLFLDYVHPTRDGNLLVARAVFDALERTGILGPPSAGGAFVYTLSPSYDEERDLAMQKDLLLLYGMMHQYESIAAKSARYVDIDGPELPFMRQAFEVFSGYVELDRKLALGVVVDPVEVQRVESNVDRFYQQRYPLLK
jgi:tetratricopeptide (TPR) repeat protein